MSCSRVLWNSFCGFCSSFAVLDVFPIFFCSSETSGTYYAGKSSTLKAVATMAHCANEGYRSAIGAPAHDGAAMLKAEKTQGARMCKSAERVASSACYFKGHVTRCGDRRSNQERNTWTEGQIVNTTHTTSKGNTFSVWTSQTSESATRFSTVYSSITLSISHHRPLLLQKRPVSVLLLLLSVGSPLVLSLAFAIGIVNVTQSIANADSCCAKPL